MNTLVQPQQDFFLYVPTMHDTQAQIPLATGKDISSLDEKLLARHEDWIEIALAESLVVYAYLWSERGQARNQN